MAYPAFVTRASYIHPLGGQFHRPNAQAQIGTSSAGPVAQAPAGPWTPPPLPAGSYNPLRDIEREESERGLQQSEGGWATGRSRTASDYQTNLEAEQRNAGYHTQDYETAKKQLGEAFQRLAGRQGEQANTAGVLRGGALLQSAAKRSANQGRQQALSDTSYQRQVAADNEQQAVLGRNYARSNEDIATQEANAKSNAAFFGGAQGRLAGAEAAAQGYVPPPTPGAPAPAGPAAPAGYKWTQQRGGSWQLARG